MKRRPADAPPLRLVALRLPVDTYRAIKVEAAKADTTVQAWATRALQAALEKESPR